MATFEKLASTRATMFKQEKDLGLEPKPTPSPKAGEGLRGDAKKPSKLERGTGESLKDFLKRKADKGMKADE